MIDHDRGQLKHLAQVASDLAWRLAANADCHFNTVGFSQIGAMRSNLKSRLWLPFTVHLTMSVRYCALTLRLVAYDLGGPQAKQVVAVDWTAIFGIDAPTAEHATLGDDNPFGAYESRGPWHELTLPLDND